MQKQHIIILYVGLFFHKTWECPHFVWVSTIIFYFVSFSLFCWLDFLLLINGAEGHNYFLKTCTKEGKPKLSRFFISPSSISSFDSRSSTSRSSSWGGVDISYGVSSVISGIEFYVFFWTFTDGLGWTFGFFCSTSSWSWRILNMLLMRVDRPNQGFFVG